MYVCMYVCMCVYMNVCMYVCMYVCIYVCMYVSMHVTLRSPQALDFKIEFFQHTTRNTKLKFFNFNQQTPKYIPAPFSMAVSAVGVIQWTKNGVKLKNTAVLQLILLKLV